ncbi:AMP-binding protein [Novosphingobium malaysiense]|uniref:AMP-dependent synthetase n=1 Tax=Novosphingobium malaysiense TaxID=1348853 RepID=A0A0B1ZI87_9SPHN|nr:AMP-binding protein [Novosphingobium malaysiense]KHK90217.1 AMP-dependent synthetase [Novosphingobium malaysiense]
MNRTPEQQVEDLIARHSRHEPLVSVLCETHDRAAVAFRFVDADMRCTELTHGELADRSRQLAAGLVGIGLGRGDRVATLMDKSEDYVATLLAIWRLGAVHVPLFTAFAYAAIELRVSGSKAKALVFDDRYRSNLRLDGGEDLHSSGITMIAAGEAETGEIALADLFRDVPPEGIPAPAIGPDDPIIHIFTSGTTGKAKGVVVPKSALACFEVYGRFALDLRKDDVFWNAADPGWAYGLYFAILLPMLSGIPSLLLKPRFSAELAVALLETFEVTNFAGAPTIYRALMACERQPSGVNLRCASSAGEPLTPDVNQWAPAALGVAVHDQYGQTEASMLINNHQHPDLRSPLKPGSMGRPMPGWTAEILAEDEDRPLPANEKGRLAFDLERSPLAWFSGYTGISAQEAGKISADGRWYITGDVAYRDEDGDFFFASRDDDVIIMAGYRIGPFDIESVLVDHPAVAEAAVVARPDRSKGEIVAAYVVLNKDRAPSNDLAAELQAWVKTRYSAHAYPRVVEFVETLPRTPAGKIQRYRLRQLQSA